MRTAKHQSLLPSGPVQSSYCLWNWLAHWARWLAEPLPAAGQCGGGGVLRRRAGCVRAEKEGGRGTVVNHAYLRVCLPS